MTPIPIGCTCGFCTGSKKTEQNCCRPTRCQTCNASVFFIRYNGGCVWVDHLGWPWPKHGCMDSDSDSESDRRSLKDAGASLNGAQLIVITDAESGQQPGEFFISLIRQGEKELWTAKNMGNRKTIRGALAIISIEEKFITHPRLGRIELIEQLSCPRGHGALRLWNNKPRCWSLWLAREID